MHPKVETTRQRTGPNPRAAVEVKGQCAVLAGKDKGSALNCRRVTRAVATHKPGLMQLTPIGPPKLAVIARSQHGIPSALPPVGCIKKSLGAGCGCRRGPLVLLPFEHLVLCRAGRTGIASPTEHQLPFVAEGSAPKTGSPTRVGQQVHTPVGLEHCGGMRAKKRKTVVAPRDALLAPRQALKTLRPSPGREGTAVLGIKPNQGISVAKDRPLKPVCSAIQFIGPKLRGPNASRPLHPRLWGA